MLGKAVLACALALGAAQPRIRTADGDVIIQGGDLKLQLGEAFNGATTTSMKDWKTSVDDSIASLASDTTNLTQQLRQAMSQAADDRDAIRQAVSSQGQFLQEQIGNYSARADTLAQQTRSDVNESITRVQRQVESLDVLTPGEFQRAFSAGLAAATNTIVCKMQMGGVYDVDSESCACQNGQTYSHTLNTCVSSAQLGLTDSTPGSDCSTILGQWPDAPDGRYYIRPDSVTFPVYCDMTTDGGGWTLIESYDISLRGAYRHASFRQNKNMPRNANSPPVNYSSAAWNDFRLPAASMMPLIDRSTEVHARCDRNMSNTMSDYMYGDISSIATSRLSGWRSRPKVGYNVWSMRGRLRGYPIEELNLRWYHDSSGSSPWHAGFDVGSEIPGSVSSEDDFTWHDGGLNSRHRCHTAAGDITWWVRGPLNLGSKEKPAMSCLQILKTEPHTANRDGPYFLQLPTVGLTHVYCDMTTHEGGWTMWLAAGSQQPTFNWRSESHITSDRTIKAGISKVFPGRLPGAPNFKLPAIDINFIRTSWRIWGSTVSPPVKIENDDVSYWRTTPTSGTGVMGAESFHRQDCAYWANRRSSQIKSSTCNLNKWWYKTGLKNEGSETNSDNMFGPSGGDWKRGGHWWNNSPAYADAFGYFNEGNSNTGSRCYNTGRGLGYHAPNYAPFHRGWCSTANWGLEFVRG